MKESFEERMIRWQRSFEDILIEMSDERTESGLLMHVDLGECVPEMNKALESVRANKEFADANPGKLTIYESSEFPFTDKPETKHA